MKPVQSFSRFQKTALAAAFVALLCSGCIEITVTQPGEDAKAQATRSAAVGTGRAISGDIDATKALTALYGGIHVPSGKREINCPEHTVRVLRSLPKEHFIDRDDGSSIHAEHRGKKVEACKIFDGKYTDQGIEKYMIVTLSQGYDESGKHIDDAHNIVSASIFVNDGVQWSLASHNDFVPDMLNFKEFVAVKGSADKKPGVLIQNTWGNRCYEYRLVAFMPYGNGVKMFNVGDYSSEYNIYELYPDRCLAPESELVHVSYDAASKSEYSDIVVELKNESGKRLASQRWRFQNGEYVKVSATKKGGKKRK